MFTNKMDADVHLDNKFKQFETTKSEYYFPDFKSGIVSVPKFMPFQKSYVDFWIGLSLPQFHDTTFE